MWKHVYVFLCTLFWSNGLSDDCITPLGKVSKCISLYDCPALVSVFNQIESTDYILSFLRQSHCGFQDRIPKVCCGPIPDEKAGKMLTHTEDNGKYSAEDSFLASSARCGIDKKGERIYGGEVSAYDDFPWMALLGYKNSAGVMTYNCGGSLINQRYVLTAAHCLVGDYIIRLGPLTSVRLGEHDMDAEQEPNCPYSDCRSRIQEIPVASIHVHPGYNLTNTSIANDIAIIRLAKRATYTYYVQPICLVKNDKLPTINSTGVIAGWGKTVQGTRSTVKRKLKVPIFDKDKCTGKFQSMNIFLNDKQFCAGGIRNQDSCRGDSGGPMMMKNPEEKWEAVGLVSFGWGCGRDTWPAVYTSVGGYLNWIRATLQSTNSN